MIGKTNATGSGGVSVSGTLNITNNGVYDVGSYASASVNVPNDFPYSAMDALMARNSSVYEGYCPSIIGSYLCYNHYSLQAFIPIFSSNWSYLIINPSAFQGCTSMSTMPVLSNSSISKYIGSYAFQGCSSLTEQVRNVQSVGANAFASTKITEFTTSTTMISFELNNCFVSCVSLQSVNITTTRSLYIGTYVFSGCTMLSSLILEGSSVYLSGTAAFRNMYPLTNLTISNIASRIQYNTLGSCTAYNINLTFLSSYISLGANFMQSCSNLETLNIATKSTNSTFTVYMTSYTFRYCSNLKTISITNPNGSVYVNMSFSGQFYGCSNLISFSYTCNGATSSCFQGCSNLRYVSMKSANNYGGNYAFKGCSKLSYIYIENPQDITNGVFEGCSSLESLLMYRSGENYGYTVYGNAFSGCTNFKSLYMFGSRVATCYNGFANTTFTDSTYLGYYGSIYVRSSLLASYKAATNWAQVSDRIVGLTDEEINQIMSAYNAVQYVPPEE